MKILKNKLGFTLVELMVGLAATGIVSLGIANLTSEQVKDQKYLETKNEEGSLGLKVRSSVARFDGCRNTLGGRSALNDTPSGIQIRSTQNTLVLDEGQIIGSSNNIVVARIGTEIVVPPSAGSRDALIALEIETTRNDTENINGNDVGVGGRTTFTQSIMVKVAVNAANQVEDCFAASSLDVSDEVEENFCLASGPGASYDPVARVCSYATCTIDGTGDNDRRIITGACIDSLEGDLDARFVNRDGSGGSPEEITGNFNIAGELSTEDSNLVARGGNGFCNELGICIEFNNKSCPAGSYAESEVTTGEIRCITFPDCPDGEFFAGIAVDGQNRRAICEDLPLGTNTCGSTGVFATRTEGSTTECELPSAPRVMVTPDHVINVLSHSSQEMSFVLDRKLRGECTGDEFISGITDGELDCDLVPDRSAFGLGCGSGFALKGIDGGGNLVCVDPKDPAPVCIADWQPLLSSQCPSVSVVQTDDNNCPGSPASQTFPGTSNAASCCEPDWRQDNSNHVCEGVMVQERDEELCSSTGPSHRQVVTPHIFGTQNDGMTDLYGNTCPSPSCSSNWISDDPLQVCDGVVVLQRDHGTCNGPTIDSPGNIRENPAGATGTQNDGGTDLYGNTCLVLLQVEAHVLQKNIQILMFLKYLFVNTVELKFLHVVATFQVVVIQQMQIALLLVKELALLVLQLHLLRLHQMVVSQLLQASQRLSLLINRVMK